MSRFRKIDMRMHGDEKYRRLTKPQACGQALWWYLIAGPQTGIIPGLFSIGEMAFAELLEWELKGFREAFREVSSKGMAKADWTARFVWIPNGIKYNAPANPNVIKSWKEAWEELPECKLKVESFQALTEFVKGLGKGFQEAFRDTIRNPLANQEQEQEQEQEKEQEQEQEQDQEFFCSEPSTTASEPNVIIVPFLIFPCVGKGSHEWPLPFAKLDELRSSFPAVDVDLECRKARQWCIDNPSKRKTFGGMPRFLSGWLGRAQDRPHVGGNGKPTLREEFRSSVEEFLAGGNRE